MEPGKSILIGVCFAAFGLFLGDIGFYTTAGFLEVAGIGYGIWGVGKWWKTRRTAAA
jgi:hypothetical protein